MRVFEVRVRDLAVRLEVAHGEGGRRRVLPDEWRDPPSLQPVTPAEQYEADQADRYRRWS